MSDRKPLDGFEALAALFEASARDLDGRAEQQAARAAHLEAQGEITEAAGLWHSYRHLVISMLLEQANAAACRIYRR